MQNVLTNVTLNDNQKQLLVRIQSAATPLLAGKECRNGQESMEAAKVLIDLGLITYSNEECVITDVGTNKMTDENLIDDSGQLTPYGTEVKANSKSNTGAATAPPPPPQPTGSEKTAGADPFESFGLLRDLNKRIMLG